MSHPPIRFLDRAKETTTTTGSGSITLGGAVDGFVAISGIGNGNSTYYTITENNDFEVGIGTYSSAGNTLSRSEVFSSSNSDNSKINLGGGATVFITYSADRVVSRTSGNYVGIGVDPEYQLHVAGTGSFNTVRWADGTVQTTAATGDISTVSGLVVDNTASISTNTSNISTNTSNISTNTSNISTNAANITATGAINAADIIEVSGDVATNTSNISTNTSNISTNTSNISTNTSNISTNTSNISTNTSNITATGAINAADIIEVSGDVATNTSLSLIHI